MRQAGPARGRNRSLVWLVAVVAILGACRGAGASPGPTDASPAPSASPGASSIPGPSASPGARLDAGDLRLVLVDRLGPRWYCDPDEYPVQRADEQTNAVERFPEMQAEGTVFDAVLRRLSLAPTTDFSVAQKVQIYRLWRVAVSIPFEAVGGGAYRFDYTAQPTTQGQQGTRTIGTIDATGTIVVERREAAGEPNCPICLAMGTRIDTPGGPVAVQDLTLGDAVWTLDLAGRRVAGQVIAVGSTTAPLGHRVVRLSLADGRSVTASPGHPLADGRRLGDLEIGAVVDGSAVVGLAWLPYAGGETFDLLVSGPTGVYLSDGIPLGSTLR